MEAISLWQPWASAVALGSKTIETRHWSTDYRGPLAIHAAKHWTRELAHMIHDQSRWDAAPNNGKPIPVPAKSFLPFGCVVAVCQLEACVRTEDAGNIDFRRVAMA